MALLHAHDPVEAGDGNSSLPRRSGETGSVGHDRTKWSTADWLEVAASIEKPVLSLNSEHANRKDERAFMQAFRASQLTVRARYIRLSWLRVLRSQYQLNRAFTASFPC